VTIRILNVNDEAREKVARIVEYASKPENLYVPSFPVHKGPTPGDNPNHTTWLNDFRCVFSFTRTPSGAYRHLSISVDHGKTTALPNPMMAQEIALLFGFTGELKDWAVGRHSRPMNCLILAQKL